MTRAIRTTEIALTAADRGWIPVRDVDAAGTSIAAVRRQGSTIAPAR